jgi:hypothetical protein
VHKTKQKRTLGISLPPQHIFFSVLAAGATQVHKIKQAATLPVSYSFKKHNLPSTFQK